MGVTQLTTRNGFPYRWYRKPTKELWAMWLADYTSEEQAIAAAIWQVNLQISGKAKSSQLKHLSIKHEFVLQHVHQSQGLFLRHVREACWHCGGTGKEPGHPRKKCIKCEGERIYKEYDLFAHRFLVAGSEVVLHSVVEPVQVVVEDPSDWAEWVEVDKPASLPFGGLLRVLSYVAVAKWDLIFFGGRYARKKPKRTPTEKDRSRANHGR